MRNILILFLIVTTELFAGDNSFVYRPEFHSSFSRTEIETPKEENDSTTVEKYPAKGLLYSLVLPGAGQWYAGAKWKSLAFVGVELASILAWSNLSQRGEDIKIDFEDLADHHWILNIWLQNMDLPDIAEYGISAIGTHDLNILLTDGRIIGSNEDEDNNGTPDWAELPDGVEVEDVIRDRDFYENIGKYNQFVGGWDDIGVKWWKVEKSVGDSIEILIMTENRNSYLDLREEHNRYLQLAAYSVSAIMFNHIISAVDAVWETRRRSMRPDKVEASLKPTFSPSSKFGIGGFSLSLRW